MDSQHTLPNIAARIRELPLFWQNLYALLPKQVSYDDLVSRGFYGSNKSASGALTSDPDSPRAYRIGRKAFYDSAELTLWLYKRDLQYRGRTI